MSFDFSLSSYSYGCDARCATQRYFQVLGSIHDIDSYYSIDNTTNSLAAIFTAQWTHLAIIGMWSAGSLFHIGWTGNFELWLTNPIKTVPIAHSIFDPHFGTTEIESNTAYSGLYNLMTTVGLTTSNDIFNLLILVECISCSFILLAAVHLTYLDALIQWLPTYQAVQTSSSSSSSLTSIHADYRLNTNIRLTNTLPFKLFTAYFDLSGSRLNFHVGIMIGISSISWAGHIVHLALPASRGIDSKLVNMFNVRLTSIFTNSDLDKDNHIWRSAYGAGNAVLTFIGSLKLDTQSLFLSDIAHHHLALGVLLVLASHLYQSSYNSFGHRLRDPVVSNGTHHFPAQLSLHLQLSLALFALGFTTSLVAQHTYSMLPYVYLSYVTNAALYVHHQYVASLLMVGALVHSSTFLVRDYSSVISTHTSTNTHGLRLLVIILLATKGQFISHLSWISLFLGFHVLALYIHNDTVSAFGEVEKQVLVEPVLALFYQHISQLAVTALGPGDLLVHHAIAFAIHTSVLVLVKGALDGRGSKLMPDKLYYSVSFACDGPTRGGTCDISTWDSFYLAAFWVLNTDAWLTFYFHWKSLVHFENTVFQFDESSTCLNGWFRDYLWFNSTSLLNGYNAFRANDLSCLSWLFLAAHLAWATGFMFLISWRGYWQELIDTLLVLHLKTPVLFNLYQPDFFTPTALSIVQARLVGVTHFTFGFILTYAAFVLASVS